MLVVQCAPSDPVARLGEWLVAAGAQLHVINAADAPLTPEGWDALVVMGGPMSAYDDERVEWIAALKQLLRAAVAAQTPTLGVCLGAQLLAAATGGRVVRNPDGPEIGAQLVAKRSAASTDPLFRAVPITPDVIQWHFDTITNLPPGAVHLANSPVCENQAFRVGRLAWGIQFHIETTAAMITSWAAANAPALADFDLRRVVERAIGVLDDIAEVWAPFAATFVEIARDPTSVAPPPAARESVAAPVSDPAAIRAALAAQMQAARAPLPMPGLRAPDG